MFVIKVIASCFKGRLYYNMLPIDSPTTSGKVQFIFKILFNFLPLVFIAWNLKQKFNSKIPYRTRRTLRWKKSLQLSTSLHARKFQVVAKILKILPLYKTQKLLSNLCIAAKETSMLRKFGEQSQSCRRDGTNPNGTRTRIEWQSVWYFWEGCRCTIECYASNSGNTSAITYLKLLNISSDACIREPIKPRRLLPFSSISHDI